MTPRSFAVTDRGTVRPHNEDSFVSAPALGLWAVADGAGGHAAGELASAMLADALSALPPGLEPDASLSQIRQAVLGVHAELCAEAERRGDAMIASTLVVLLVRDGHFAVLWAGDSRAYLLRAGTLSQITTDHSLVQTLVDQGAITPQQALVHPQANVITRAIGAPDDTAELDKLLGATAPGDIFLLCSDGLNKVLDDASLANGLAHADPAQALIAAALSAGARDNITAVVVQIPDDAVAA